MDLLNRRKEFLKYYDPVHEEFIRYCSVLSNYRMETADLVQDVLLSAFQNFDGINNKKQLKHYLIRSAKYKFISAQRKKRADTIDQSEYNDRLIATGISPETAYDIQELYKAIGQLPGKQSEAIILFEVSGFSVKEISEIQKSSESAVKTRLSRARQTLRKMFDSDLQNNFQTLKSIVL